MRGGTTCRKVGRCAARADTNNEGSNPGSTTLGGGGYKIINNAVFQSAEDVCDHLLGPQVQGAGHGHVEAVDVEHGQHGEGGLLLQPRRRQHELRVVAVERVAARHQVPLGQSHALR